MAYREYVDNRGTAWRVWATVPDQRAHLPEELREGWLTFESDFARKRLAPIPNGWEYLSDERLSMLCRVAIASPSMRLPAAELLGDLRDADRHG